MATFDRFRRYLRLPSRTPQRIRRDVEDELQLQIDLRTEALEREGWTSEAARAEARRRFGDLEDATRYCAEVDGRGERRRRLSGWLSEVRQDAGHTFRILRRTPAFGGATVLTLALAIGATTAVYGVLHAYLLQPMPFPEANRLVSVLDAPTLDRSRRGPSLGAVRWTSIDSLFSATVAWDLDGKTYLAPAAAAKLAEGVTRVQLTPREMATLRLLADGKANKEIANELDISERTVKTHLAHLFEKLGVTSRTEAIKVATRRGLVRLE